MRSPGFFKRCLALVVLAVGLASTVSVDAADRGRDRHGEDRRHRGRDESANSGMSLDEAVSMVEKRFKARVVRTEVRGDGDRKIYVLRLLNDAGRVWTVRVDAASGSVN